MSGSCWCSATDFEPSWAMSAAYLNDEDRTLKTNLQPISRLLAVGSVMLAMSGVPAAADNHTNGDAEAGKAKSTTCAACHGTDGNSLNPTWPSLAAQHPKYIAQQLQWFKEGKRNNVLMNAQAMGLSEQDMLDLSAYYASQTAVERQVANADSVDKAKRLYRGGDSERGIPACIACHGPGGAGNPGVPYPSVGGQHAAYIASSLREYAADDDKRSNTEAQNSMTTIAQRLTPDEIDALASYIQGLN